MTVELTLPSHATSRSAPRDGGLFLFLMVTLLGFAVPGLFLSSVDAPVSFNTVLTFGIILWSVWRLAHTAAAGERRLSVLCFYVFVYTFLGVQPMMSVLTETYPYEPFLTSDEAAFTIALVAIGIAAFEVGYSMLRTSRARQLALRSALEVAARPRPVNISKLWVAVGASLGLLAIALFRYGPNIFIGVRGGGFVFSDRIGPAMEQTEWLLVIYGLRALLASLLFVSLYLWKSRQAYDWSKRSVARLRAMLVLLSVVNIIVSNPFSAARLWSGSILLTVIIIAVRWKGTRSLLAWSTISAIGLLTLFAGVDPRRIIAGPLLRGEEIGLASSAKVISESVSRVQTDGNFDAFQLIGLTAKYADAKGYSMGKQILLPIFFWVPRSVWSGKPIGTPDVVADYHRLIFSNVASPLWAEGYVNGGVIGLVLVLGLFGAFSRICDDYLTRTVDTGGSLFPTIISAYFASNMLILLRGDLTTGTMHLQMVIGFTLAILLFARRRLRRELPSPAAP